MDAEVIPGLTSLPAQDRERVWRQCVHDGLRDKVSKLTLVALGPLVGLGAVVFGTIGGVIGGGVGGLIFGIVAAVRVRSCLRTTVAARLRDNALETGGSNFEGGGSAAGRPLDGGAIALCIVAGVYGVSQYLDVRSPHLTAGGLILGLVFWAVCAVIIAGHALAFNARTVPPSPPLRPLVFLLTLGVIPTLYGVSYFWYLRLGSTAGVLVAALSGAYLFTRFRPRFPRRATPVLAALFLGASIFFLLQDICFDTLTMGSQTLAPRIRQGDKVAINKLAFGLRVPFWSRYLVSWAGPERGDLVAFLLEDGRPFVKEVLRVDGYFVEVKDLGIVQRHRLRGRVVASG